MPTNREVGGGGGRKITLKVMINIIIRNFKVAKEVEEEMVAKNKM